jgi:hypothetical protein
MLYGIEEEMVAGVNTAVLACRKKECGYKEPLSSDNPVVYEHSLRQESVTSLVMNPYLKHDPTLEHLKNVVCPNEECPTKKNPALVPDVVPVEIDGKRLIWMYQCAHCSKTWTQASRFAAGAF